MTFPLWPGPALVCKFSFLFHLEFLYFIFLFFLVLGTIFFWRKLSHWTHWRYTGDKHWEIRRCGGEETDRPDRGWEMRERLARRAVEIELKPLPLPLTLPLPLAKCSRQPRDQTGNHPLPPAPPPLVERPPTSSTPTLPHSQFSRRAWLSSAVEQSKKRARQWERRRELKLFQPPPRKTETGKLCK